MRPVDLCASCILGASTSFTRLLLSVLLLPRHFLCRVSVHFLSSSVLGFFLILPLAHLSVLSAAFPPVSFSPCCRGDASFRPLVIESHEYFSRHPSSHISSCHFFFYLSSALFHSQAASPSFSRHPPLPLLFSLSSPSFASPFFFHRAEGWGVRTHLLLLLVSAPGEV